MRRRTGINAALAVVGVTALLASVAGVAQADSATTGGFESYTAGDINGQDGWVKTGPYDVNIVDPTGVGITDMGNRALQVSNAAVSGSFGDQAFSKQLADEAGESSAQGDGTSGTRQRVFTASFSVRTTSQDEQEGLYTSISPDRGDGARMSYLRLEDQSDGVHVFFDDYQKALGDFDETDVATLDRADKHTVSLSMVFLDGAANDVVRVSVDGSVVHTGTSWEDYFRDEEGNPTRTVDSLLFREGGSGSDARPSLKGRGFLFDDVYLTSSGTDNCSFTTTGTTMTLAADCTTDHTIPVPDGYTLDGDGHSITAVDPDGGHWVGAVVQNAGDSANVTNLGVTADIATACDAGAASLAGIRFDGASGSITSNVLDGVEQGASGDGCQEGNAIDVVDNAGTDTSSVVVSSNTVTHAQKTGIRVNGSVSAEVSGNTVTGYGPVDFIAENGIQVSRGATALVEDNTVTGHDYTPEDTVSCGVILFEADGVRVRHNDYDGNELNLCNVGRGGGNLSET